MMAGVLEESKLSHTCYVQVFGFSTDVYQRVTAVGDDVLLVVDDDNIVLGRLRQQVFAQHPKAIVGDVMEEGPTTIRPNTKLADIIPRMQARNVNSIVVPTSNGRLAGILYRQDGEATLEKQSIEANE